ncbi:hypothetical protein D3C83_131870 [compost metagenome]
MPTVASTVYTGRVSNEPMSTRNSLMNELVPGSDRVLSPAISSVPASSGVTFAMPP